MIIERYSAGADETGYGPLLNQFIALARGARLAGQSSLADGRVRESVADAYRLQQALVTMRSKAFLALANGDEPGAEGSIHKLVSARARQELSELALDLEGPVAHYDANAKPKENWVASWLAAPTGRIAGGTDEILLNIIAEKILGLPQDHRPDKGVPFDLT
jgi:alkylation response protein AidB-like acyl-CoA dehydrogenase